MSSSEASRPGAPAPGRPHGSSRPSLRNAVGVFANPHYRRLWASSAFAFTGMQMQQVARALLAWELTGSYGAVGAISLSFGLPMMLFSLVGGSLADRFEKRNLTLMTQTSTGVLAAATAVLIVTNTITIELLFVIGLVQGTFFALGMPARTPLMAEVAGPENVMNAIAMSNAAMNFTRLFGPALAGGIIAFWGIDGAYFVQSTFYAVSAALLLTVPTGLSAIANAGMQRGPQGNMFVEIGRGLRYAATDPRLRLLFAMLFIVTFFAMPYVMLLAGFVEEDLGRGGGGAFGILQSVMGAGALIGSLGVATMTAFERKPLLQWVAGITGGLGLVGLAVGSGLFGYAGALAAVVVIGLALTAYQTLNNTMLMDAARPEYYGRVMSINMLTFSVMPMMAYPMGLLADYIGASETFVAQGLVVLGFMLIVGLVNPRHTFGRHEATPAERPRTPLPTGASAAAADPGRGPASTV